MFQVGDVVRLKSGGPAMVINAINESGSKGVHLAFRVSDGIGYATVRPECLERCLPDLRTTMDMPSVTSLKRPNADA